MNADRTILAHGGATGSIDILVGLGPIILGGVLIVAFVLLLATDRSSAARSGYRDERPTSARLLFSGRYFQLEELLAREAEPRPPRADAGPPAGEAPAHQQAQSR